VSSSSFNVIRKHSLHSTSIRIKELTQALAKQRSDLANSQLETEDIRSHGRMDHSTVKLNDERLKFITTLSASNSDFFYEFPTEPDHDKLKVWFMLDHLGARMRDMSGFGNDAYISGHPTLRRVGLDIGFQQTALGGGLAATVAMIFNSGTDVVSQRNGEYIWIPDNTSIQFKLFPVGFSITFRFNALDFNNHSSAEFGTFIRRFAAKTDDALNGWNLVLFPTNAAGTQGGIEMNILHDGVTYKRKSSVVFTAGLWYQIVITYDPNLTADLRIKIYIAGTELSAPGVTTVVLPTHPNLRIGARDSETAFFYGYIQDFRMYMDKVLNQTEITNINTNEMTIDNITKGHLFVVQYALVAVLSRARTHKYNMSGRIKRTRSHKYNVTQRITETNTHKYFVLTAISRVRTHKYNVLGKITRVRTHKFSMGGKLTVAKTHKFNITQKITRTRTHKYNVGGLQTQYQRFTKSATAGSNIVQEVTFSSTPQALIVWSGGTTADNTFTDGYQLYYGYSDGTNHACVSSFAADNVSNTQAFSGHKSDKIISMMNTTLGTVASEATVAFAANKATFTWTTNDNRAVYIHCMAIWGASAAEVKTFTTGTTTTGNRTYNLTNSQLNPKLIHTINRGGPVSWDVAYANAVCIGAAVSSTQRWTVGNAIEADVSSSEACRSYYDQTNVLVSIDDDDTGVVEATAALTSLNTGNFVLNWTDAPTSTTNAFSVLVIDADVGSIDVGTFNEPATTGTQVVSVASTVDAVKGVMIFNNGFATSGLQLDALISIGGASGTGATEQGVISVGDDDINGVGNSISSRVNKTGSIIRTIFPAATAASSTTTSEAALSALGTDQFSLNWTARNSTRRNHYIVFGT
jgi:hypothetical protein